MLHSLPVENLHRLSTMTHKRCLPVTLHPQPDRETHGEVHRALDTRLPPRSSPELGPGDSGAPVWIHKISTGSRQHSPRNRERAQSCPQHLHSIGVSSRPTGLSTENRQDSPRNETTSPPGGKRWRPGNVVLRSPWGRDHGRRCGTGAAQPGPSLLSSSSSSLRMPVSSSRWRSTFRTEEMTVE